MCFDNLFSLVVRIESHKWIKINFVYIMHVNSLILVMSDSLNVKKKINLGAFFRSKLLVLRSSCVTHDAKLNS